MSDAKEVGSPLPTSSSLRLHDGTPQIDPITYRQVLLSLKYLSITRPNVAYPVNKPSQFMHSPSSLHWQMVKRLLRYLKDTLFHGLLI